MMSKYLTTDCGPISKFESRTDVKTLTYTSTSMFRGKKKLERGRVQIWNPKRLERHPPDNSQGRDFSKHRKSVGTGSLAAGSLNLSTVSSTARRFATSYSSTAMTETTTGFNFEKPSSPLLIFYLRADEVDKMDMSFLSIERRFCSLEAPKSPGL